MTKVSQMYAKDGRNLEMETLEKRLKRTVWLCKKIWEYREDIDAIKQAIKDEDFPYASGLWNDLTSDVQKTLNTAPRFGGAFTTGERKVIRGFWEISESDIFGQM